jgi:ApaG protein
MVRMARPEFTSKVAVRPLPEQTDAANDQYAYAYTITITNTGDVPAQLVARHWHITDHRGQVQEVRGLGVVGHQPLLKPGESFEYTSWAQIGTPQGSMHGHYIGITEDAQWFESPVPEFALADAAALH